MFGVERWLFTIWTLFLLCPRRYLILGSPRHQWSNSKNGPVPKHLLANGRQVRLSSSLNVTTDKLHGITTDSRPEEAEPGFDFTEEEMSKLKIWPGGAIPYYIDEFSFDKVLRDRIRNFLDITNSMTGLNFLELYQPPGDDETRWVFFLNRQGLLSCIDHPFKNFTNEGVQKILLGYDCLSNGGELAQIVLALVGIPPQHNDPKRKEYIEIVKENIMPGKSDLFEILHDNEWLFHDVDYDFASAGHYSLHKYTVNGKATIKPLQTVKGISVGEAKGFSYMDIRKIKMTYNYISKKRLKSASVPECNKLFNLGTDFSNNIHESEDDLQPRKKPSKYLGVPDTTENPASFQETNNETEINTPNTDTKLNTEENVNENFDENEQNIQNDEKKLDHNIKKDYDINDVSILNKELKNSSEIEVVNGEDPPAHVLDDSVDEDVTQKILKFTRPGIKTFRKKRNLGYFKNNHLIHWLSH